MRVNVFRWCIVGSRGPGAASVAQTTNGETSPTPDGHQTKVSPLKVEPCRHADSVDDSTGRLMRLGYSPSKALKSSGPRGGQQGPGGVCRFRRRQRRLLGVADLSLFQRSPMSILSVIRPSVARARPGGRRRFHRRVAAGLPPRQRQGHHRRRQRARGLRPPLDAGPRGVRRIGAVRAAVARRRQSRHPFHHRQGARVRVDRSFPQAPTRCTFCQSAPPPGS